MVSIRGEITPGDERVVEGFLAVLRSDGRARVDIQSKGGDVQTALAIGRVLRRHDAVVRTGECLSSCVFVLIGGVVRVVMTNALRGTGVGLHRPYFGALPPNLTSADITNRRNKLKEQIATYINEMNVTSRLLDLMEAIPPEKMKMLTDAELEDLGLNASDPVWDEKVVANTAALHGVSSVEFRNRRANSEAKCPYPRFAQLQKTPPEKAESLFQDQDECSEAILWGLSRDEYRSRDGIYKGWLAASPYVDRGLYYGSPSDIAAVLRCYTRIMTTGARTCTP